MLIKRQSGKKRPVFIRQPVRYTLALLAEYWLRLEQRWEDNPGFVAATVAGSLGLFLTAAMLINAGLGWLQESPNGDDVAVESPDVAEPDLGDSNADDILVVRNRELTGRRNRNAALYRDAAVDESDDESDDQVDPFAESKSFARPIVSKSDEDIADDRSTSEPDESETDELVDTLPVRKPIVFEDDDDSVPDEPPAKRSLPEMRVASQPHVSERFEEMDDDEESSTNAADQVADAESNSPPPEPARLKSIEPADRLDVDDDRPEPSRSIDFVRAPPDSAPPREDSRWKQQRGRSAAETTLPEVVARQSRPVETKVFAVRPIRSDEPRAVPAVKEDRVPREKSAAPPLRLAISGPPSVGIGQPCQVEIRVTNTGSVPAHCLVVSAELPEGLVHAEGTSLEQQIKTLAPGATYRALLRLRGEAVGEKTIQAEVSIGDQATLGVSSKVRVKPASETTTTIGDADCFCAPLVR